MRILLLLSGPSAVGKTTISNALQEQLGFSKVSTSLYLKQIAINRGLPSDKAMMQLLGDGLDEETDFTWVADAVALPAFEQRPRTERWLLDSVRKHRQVEVFRERYGDTVLHLHLTAPEDLLRTRYEDRRTSNSNHADDPHYEEVIEHSNEISSRSLGSIANLRLDVSSVSLEEIVGTVATFCRSRVSDA